MDKSALKDVFSKRFDNIHKNASKATPSFDEESIHHLRVGYKRLRAFIRLLNTQEKIKLPDSLKKLYRAAGALRNLQIYFRAVKDHCLKNDQKIPIYTGMLSEEMRNAGYAYKTAAEDVSFNKIKEQLEEKLPGTSPEEGVIEFIESDKDQIRMLLLSPLTDTDIHSIRKGLKDMLYTFQLFNEEHLFEVPGLKEQSLKKATDALGAYVDICINLRLLEPGLLTNIPENEKNVLLQLKQTWAHEKIVQKTAVEVMLPGIV